MFASTWPQWVLVAAFLAGAVAIVSFLLRRREMGGLKLAAIGALQLAMLALALFILWEPSLVVRSLKAGENAIAVMLDTSESMGFTEGEQTRMQQAQAALGSDALGRLGKDYALRRFVFARDASATEDYSTLPAPGTETALAGSLLQVLRQARTSAVGAVVIVSDGGENAGTLDQEQLAEIASLGVPVHTIGVGREKVPEDLELQEVLAPERTLPGTTLSARVTVRHDGAGVARLKVYDGDKFLASREITLPADGTVTTAFVDFGLQEPGFRDLNFSLDGKEGEAELRNNARATVVEVPQEPSRILYVEGEPRWEYKFMRRALDDDASVRLVSLLRVSPNGFYRQGIDAPQELQKGFPTDAKELFKYDALVIGNVQAAWFTPEQQQMIADFVSERGGSLMMLAGSSGLGDGGWGKSIVGELLPAQLPADGPSFRRERAAVVVTARGSRSPMLRLSDDDAENARLWGSLPELADYQTLGALKPAANSLLNVKIGDRQQPLLVTQLYGRGRSWILATGGTWRWQMGLPVADQRHEAFWRQLARGLVADTPERFQVTARSQGDTVLLRAELRDEAFKPQQGVTVTAVATRQAGEPLTVDLRPSADQPGVFEAEVPAAESGLFSVEALARRGDQTLATTRMAMRHESGRAEYFSVRQNRPLLEQLAQATGGRYWTADQLDGLPEAIRYSAAGVTQQEIRALWNMPALFLVLLLLKAGEWLLRRRWSVV
ncbi:MAG: hypothetical protein ABL964_16115 [Steroidobacteraceae bacterium]